MDGAKVDGRVLSGRVVDGCDGEGRGSVGDPTLVIGNEEVDVDVAVEVLNGCVGPDRQA